jgi:hypothetical protein
MTDLSQQTEQILKALQIIHNDLTQMHMTNMIVGTVVSALLLVIAFRKR